MPKNGLSVISTSVRIIVGLSDGNAGAVWRTGADAGGTTRNRHPPIAGGQRASAGAAPVARINLCAGTARRYPCLRLQPVQRPLPPASLLEARVARERARDGVVRAARAHALRLHEQRRHVARGQRDAGAQDRLACFGNRGRLAESGDLRLLIRRAIEEFGVIVDVATNGDNPRSRFGHIARFRCVTDSAGGDEQRSLQLATRARQVLASTGFELVRQFPHDSELVDVPVDNPVGQPNRRGRS